MIISSSLYRTKFFYNIGNIECVAFPIFQQSLLLKRIGEADFVLKQIESLATENQRSSAANEAKAQQAIAEQTHSVAQQVTAE